MTSTAYQQPGTHAATTARYRGTDAANRCRACGHRIGKGSMMTKVHWWNDLHIPERLRTERYHAECAPPFDASRVVLYRPGFEWRETSMGNLGPADVRLVPAVAHQVVDTVSGRRVRDMGKAGRGFIASASCTDFSRDHWEVTTQGCGTGSRRYTRAWSMDEAKAVLEAWYIRRFRFADTRTPATEQEV